MFTPKKVSALNIMLMMHCFSILYIFVVVAVQFCFLWHLLLRTIALSLVNHNFVILCVVKATKKPIENWKKLKSFISSIKLFYEYVLNCDTDGIDKYNTPKLRASQWEHIVHIVQTNTERVMSFQWIYSCEWNCVIYLLIVFTYESIDFKVSHLFRLYNLLIIYPKWIL